MHPYPFRFLAARLLRRTYFGLRTFARLWVILGLSGVALHTPAQAAEFGTEVKSRARVVIDNDFGGDPDGLFQLAHHLLSPSVEVRGIIGSHLYPSGFYDAPGSAEHACKRASELLARMPAWASVPLVTGAESSLVDRQTPTPSAGAELIVTEALRADVNTPLYVVCGASLTNIASAYLIEPRIADRIILVWIGGPEHSGLALPPPRAARLEYNLGIDLIAAQVIFDDSRIAIWQVPRDAYRLALVSYAEMRHRLSAGGELTRFLFERLTHLSEQARHTLGETYVLGDSPLVLLTALQTPWEADPASSHYVLKPTPKISSEGTYIDRPDGRPLRVYRSLDTRLMFEDFYAKIALFESSPRP